MSEIKQKHVGRHRKAEKTGCGALRAFNDNNGRHQTYTR